MSGPHDRFIRYVLEHPERAAALLHTLLPPGFVARVDWSTLRSHPTALVDPAIRETRGTRASRSGCAAARAGPSSSSSTSRAWMGAWWYACVSTCRACSTSGSSSTSAAGRRQLLILPVVLYHGPREPRTEPRRLEELLKISLEDARWEGG
jgi:hypothetical protein